MTVVRSAEFSLTAAPPEARSAVRAVLRSSQDFGSVQEVSTSFAFLRAKGQEFRLDVAIAATRSGSAVMLTSTSPPYVHGDVFGGYRTILNDLQSEIENAVASGSRDEDVFDGVCVPLDDRSAAQVHLGMPPAAHDTDARRGYTSARVVLLVVMVGWLILAPWFVTHLSSFAAWFAAATAALALERYLAKNSRPQARTASSPPG